MVEWSGNGEIEHQEKHGNDDVSWEWGDGALRRRWKWWCGNDEKEHKRKYGNGGETKNR